MDSAPTPRSRACFHARPAGFVPEDRPLALSSQVHLSTAKSSSEFLRDHQPARGLSARARLTGSRPSSRHHRAASTHRGGIQPSATFRPQAFSASRRFAPPLSSAGLFHPAATSRVPCHRSGVSHPPQPALPRRKVRAPLPLPVPRSPRRTRAATPSPPRLRGLHPRRTALLDSGG